jgi:hypothetical protein
VPPSARSSVPRCSGAAGLRAVPVAEELGLDVRLGDGGAVQLDKDLVPRRLSA